MTSAAVLAMTGMSVSAAYGQDAETEAGAGETRDVITITARRREEGLLEAPVAVSAFTDEQIRELSIQSVDDVARFTPGLSFSAAFGRSTERPVVRGQSNVLAGVQFGVESGTAYFVDGVYFPATIQNLDPNDIARVEVIKGPQSALYGRNTYAGAINFITRGAADEFEANASIRYGSYDERDLSVRAAGPIIPDRLGYSVSVRDYSYDGEWTNTVTGETVGSRETFSISGVLDFTPDQDWDFRFRVGYSEDDDGPLPIFLQAAEDNNCVPGYRSNAYWPSGSTNDNQYYCGVIQPGAVALNTAATVNPQRVAGVPDNPGMFFPGFRVATLPFPPFGVFAGGPFSGPYDTRDGTAFDGIEREQTLFSMNSSWDIGGSGYVASFLAGYRSEDESQGFDSDHSAVNVFHPFFGDEPFFANTGRSEVEDYSLEFKLESPTDRRFRWMLGAFYYDQEDT
ncbi:MAG: TonB-dependent receptor, partial [Oceanicaulis sp.]